jgi:N-acetylmuramoyl-L-alanine amidase
VLAAVLGGVVSAVALAILATVASSPALPRRSRPPVPLVRAKGRVGNAELVGRGGPIPFSPAACLGFQPAGRWNGVTVFLDPGHGGVDPGATPTVGGRLIPEKQVTLAVAVRALALLRGSGYRVVMSRVRDSTVARVGAAALHQGRLIPDAAQREVEARNLCADTAHANVLVGLHMNSFSNPSASGAETIYCPSRPFAGRSRRLADLIQRSTVAARRRAGIATVDRGVLPDRYAGGAPLTPQTENYHHLIELGPADPPWLPHPSLMPGVIVEPAFVSNPTEASFVLSAAGQDVLAAALVDALDSYFGMRRLA